MELSNVKALEPGMPKIERRFYDIEAMQKAVMIGYLLSSVRMLGFRGFFDPLAITVNKNALIQYLTNNRQKIEDIMMMSFTTSQLTSSKVIQWLNSKLDPLLSIRVRALSKHAETPIYVIDSPWRIDMSGIESRILHYPLETNVDYEQYLKSYVDIMHELINRLPAKQSPTSFDQCYNIDPNYPGGIIITDIINWNYFINNDRDPVFQQRAYDLYKKHVLYQNYQNYISKLLSANKHILPWSDYLALHPQIPDKQLSLNIVKLA
jgi:hypothetical protein